MVSGGKICKKYVRIDEADQKDDFMLSVSISHSITFAHETMYNFLL